MKERRLYKRHTATLPARIEAVMTSGKKRFMILKPETYLLAEHSFIPRSPHPFRKEHGLL
jgi:hypothetical protein